MDAQFCGQRQREMNLLDRAIPNLLVILVFFIANGARHQQHRRTVDQVGVSDGCPEAVEPIAARLGIRRGEPGAPVDRIDNAVNREAGFAAGGSSFLFVHPARAVEFHPVVANLLEQLELFGDGDFLIEHAELDRLENARLEARLVFSRLAKRRQRSGGQGQAAGFPEVTAINGRLTHRFKQKA